MKVKKIKSPYSPLPNNLTIKESEIHGLGLFATEHIDEGIILGVTHVKDGRFENGYIRTPLGGFFNHSENPNCEAVPIGKDFLVLKTIKPIDSGQELVATYWLYSI